MTADQQAQRDHLNSEAHARQWSLAIIVGGTAALMLWICWAAVVFPEPVAMVAEEMTR